jgi:hypothetical protein
VFNFLIPVIRASNRMKNQMREFQDKMNQQNQFQDNHTQFSGRPQNGASMHENKSKTGDYIDFEEIKS